MTKHLIRTMSRWQKVSVAAAATAALTATILQGPLAGASSDGRLSEIRRATSDFRDVDEAIEAGYVQFFGCVHEPLAGAMGIHFVNAALVGDPVIDVTKPEALMYEVRGNGSLALIGVEYVVFQEAWDAANAAPPVLFGEEFHLIEEPNRYGIPAFYERHAWAWKDNPTGQHEDWNPTVLCPGTEGHTH